MTQYPGQYGVPGAQAVTRSRGLGVASSVCAIIALVGAIIAAVILAGMIVNGQATGGHEFSDIPSDDQTAIGLWSLSYVLWTILGITALVLGIIAIVQKRGRGWGITGLIAAVLAPIISGITWVLVMAIMVNTIEGS